MVSLSHLLQEAGASSCATVSAFKGLVGSLSGSAFSEKEVARAIMAMARTSADPTALLWGGGGTGDGAGQGQDRLASNQNWDYKNFCSAIAELNPKIDWALVFKSLDQPEFLITDLKSLELLLSIFRSVFSATIKFPIDQFFNTIWKNIKGQVSFLHCTALAPKDLFDLLSASSQKILSSESLVTVPPSTKATASQWLSSPWNSFDLISTLIKLAEIEEDDDAKQLLDLASRQATELVLLGLCQVKQPWSALHAEVVSKLISIFLIGHSSASFVLARVWQANQSMVINSMVSLHRQEPTTLSRILDVAQDLKALNTILDNKNYGFVIDLAALAARREYLNLEKWLLNRASSIGEPFLTACLDFIQMKLVQANRVDQQAAPQTIPLAEESMATFLRVFQAKSSLFQKNSANLSILRETQSLATQIFPNLTGLSDEVTANNGEVTFKQEIEDQANSYYEKIYTGEMTVGKVIDLLHKFNSSTSSVDKDVFACMIHNLFDEYRFFPKYPDKELVVTGELFGSLIRDQLMSPVRLALGLRIVLDSLKKQLGSKMFRFGLTALLQFRNRLSEWPQYCAHLLQVNHLVEANPEVTQMLNQALAVGNAKDQRQTLPQKNETGNAMTTGRSQETEGGNALSLASKDVPSDAVRDKLLFIINNISFSNLDAKIKDLVTVLKEEHYVWFSNYLVVKRISIEPNFHSLYAGLLDALNISGLRKNVIAETLKNIRILLTSEKTVTSSQERTLLKNLGAWLGGITLAKDKPIKHNDLPLKDLLLDSVSSNRLIVAIPFICKILEQCKTSRVFRPPNPWLMALLGLLAELYTFAELKLNLKFEIEVMCKNADFDLKDIKPTNYFSIGQTSPVAGRTGYEEYDTGMLYPQQQLLQQQFQQSLPQQPQQMYYRERPPLGLPVMPAGGPIVSFDEAGNLYIPNLAQMVSFASNPPVFDAHPALKKVVLMAVDRSIREIAGPVVERSVSIATITTRELVLKDFSQEPNEERMRRAAHLMGRNLAANLSMITSKEPFRVSFTTNLRNLFVQSGLAEPMIEVLVPTTVQENIDLGCQVVEKIAMEKVSVEIDEVLAAAYMARRHQREQGIPWNDMSEYSTSRYLSILPDGLRLHPGMPQQMKVYDDFSQVGVQGPIISQVWAATASEMPFAPSSQDKAALQAANPLQQIMDKISSLLKELDRIILQNPKVSLSTLPPNHEIVTLVRQIIVAATQFTVRDELAVWFAQKLVNLLYASEIVLAIEIYIILLEKICELSKLVSKEFTTWLLYSDDQRKQNTAVTSALIQSGLLNVAELDSFLAKRMLIGNASMTEFIVKLVHGCICSDQPIVTPSEFSFVLDSMSKLFFANQLPPECLSMVGEIRVKAPGLFRIPEPADIMARKEASILAMEDYVRLYENSVAPELFAEWYQKEKHIFEDDVNLCHFVRFCVELSMDAYYRLRNAPGGSVLAYQIIDSLTSMLVYIAKKAAKSGSGDMMNSEVKAVDCLSKILSVVVLIMVHVHETRRELFDQRPFLRFFTGLLDELYRESVPEFFVKTRYELLAMLCNTLRSIRPSFMPGFVFAWLQLIAHRRLLPRLMAFPEKKAWPLFNQLLAEMFRFLSPFLRHAEMTDPIRVLYKGTLRVLLLLLHDYPEFLCDFHFSFCDVVPPSCIQLRNLILSAFPRNMRLPDPFTPNLKVDLLPEIGQTPVILSDYTSVLREHALLKGTEQFLKARSPSNYLQEMTGKLLLPSTDLYVTGTKYNAPLINALVLYVGVFAVQQLQASGNKAAITQGAPMDVFQHLARELDTEGRYHLLNAITNQLRYPNSHTHYFSCVLLYIFAESNLEIIQEQITRVLLERLIVNRPHPWGLLITFIELLKNPRYNFWNHGFTHCAPDIERLFESVARSCMIPANGNSNGSADSGGGLGPV